MAMATISFLLFFEAHAPYCYKIGWEKYKVCKLEKLNEFIVLYNALNGSEKNTFWQNVRNEFKKHIKQYIPVMKDHVMAEYIIQMCAILKYGFV